MSSELPDRDATICARLLFACTGHPHALIPWPHRLLHDAVAHIAAKDKRIEELEAEAATFSRAYGLVIAQRDKAEARVRELEEALSLIAMHGLPDELEAANLPQDDDEWIQYYCNIVSGARVALAGRKPENI